MYMGFRGILKEMMCISHLYDLYVNLCCDDIITIIIIILDIMIMNSSVKVE